MVSTLTPAALAKAPMVRFSKIFCIFLDSVHDYGSKVTPFIPVSTSTNQGSNMMGLTTRIADKAGALGAIVSAMGCAACFPAIASLGAAIGLGFLSHYE